MTVYWSVWLFGGFLIPELVALLSKHPQNTFSDFVWRVCDVMPGQTFWQWKFAHLALAFVMFWLFFHFVLHLFR